MEKLKELDLTQILVELGLEFAVAGLHRLEQFDHGRGGVHLERAVLLVLVVLVVLVAGNFSSLQDENTALRADIAELRSEHEAVHEAAARVPALAAQAFAPAGCEVEQRKTKVWVPSGPCPAGCASWWSPRGLRFLGAPVARETPLAALGELGAAVGEAGFVAEFLDQAYDAYQAFVGKVVSATVEADSTAIAPRIARPMASGMAPSANSTPKTENTNRSST